MSVAGFKKMLNDEEKKGFNDLAVLRAYANKVKKTKDKLMSTLIRLKKEGKTIIGYGASGRGTMILNYCGIDNRYLDYVVDDAPAKHGFYTPGNYDVRWDAVDAYGNEVSSGIYIYQLITQDIILSNRMVLMR